MRKEQVDAATGNPAGAGTEPAGKPDAQRQQVVGVPVCISVEEMFNIINQKLDAILRQNANN